MAGGGHMAVAETAGTGHIARAGDQRNLALTLRAVEFWECRMSAARSSATQNRAKTQARRPEAAQNRHRCLPEEGSLPSPASSGEDCPYR